MPRFDSDFLFGSLLDEEKGGEFSIRPVDSRAESHQYYLPNTNILATEFVMSDGSRFRVLDYAPRFLQVSRAFKPLMLFRKIELLNGAPQIKIVCTPTHHYGQHKAEVSEGSNHLRFLGYNDQVRLTTDVPLAYIKEEKEFVLTQNKYLCFSYGIPLEAPLAETAEEFLFKTTQYWQKWVKSMSISQLYQEQVIRSGLVLKLHQYEDTGGIIAAGTTSLPEFPGSTRNWDYRYCWMRDTYYTLNALNSIGHFEESEKYFEYIVNIIRKESNRIQPLFSITGEHKLTEIEIPLSGYLGNTPVRIGNDAFTHIQNDVYGQVLASILPMYIDARLVHLGRLDHENIRQLMRLISKTMEEKDAGIWEFRNLSQHHTYTYLFHWAGAKAAKRIAIFTKDEAMQQEAEVLMDKAASYIERAYDPERKAYMQAVDSKHLDASCLQLITMHYLDPSSEKAQLHLQAMEKELMSDNGLFYRYVHKDDFGLPETTFLVCSFWYVEALACVGRVDDAVKTLDRVIQHANHLNLFSEDVGVDGSQWGNFPQTYSHVGLMNAVYRISAKQDHPTFY
jgi:glucoamylase